MSNKLLLNHQGYLLQAPFLFKEIKYFFLIAGYAAGKSSVLATLLLVNAKLLQGKKDTEGHGARLLIGGVSIAHLIKTTIGLLKEDLENAHIPYQWDSKNNRVIIGTVTIILAAISEPGKIVGYDCASVYLDELDDAGSSNAADLGWQAFIACTERCRQVIKGWRKPSITVATSSQGQAAVFRIYSQFKKNGVGFVMIHAMTKDNFYLDPDYVASLYKVYSPIETKVYLEGALLALATGKVFGDFSWDTCFINHDLNVVGAEIVYWAADFNSGFNRSLVGVVRNGVAYVVKDYEFTDIREAPKVVRHDFPNNKIYWIPDASSKGEIQHFTAELHKYGIYWVIRSKNPSVEDSAFAVNKMFYTHRLIVCKLAMNTAEDCARATRDKNGLIPKGALQTSPIHRCDTMRYFCYFILSTVPALRDLRRVTIWRHMSRAYDEEVLVEDMGEGFQKVSPNAFAPEAKKTPFKHHGEKLEKPAKPRGRPPKIHKVDA